MDIKSLKLELFERIALIDDEQRLLTLKRVLDAPRGYGIPNERLNVVKEEAQAYERQELRYSKEEVIERLRAALADRRPA